jgi:hypothetical protein
MELFAAITPEDRWVGHSISFVTTPADRAAASGCQGFFGLESRLPAPHHGCARRRRTSRRTRVDPVVRASGPLPLVLGFDGRTCIFEDTRVPERNKISTASINVLTPYLGDEGLDR